MMKRPLFSLISLALLLSTSQAIFTSNPHPTQNGKVPLRYYGGSGFFVQVDFANNVFEASDSDSDSDAGPMQLGLYTSNTMLVQGSCQEFTQYNCGLYSCNAISQTSTYAYPYFTATYQSGTNKVYLDYGYWQLFTNPLLVSSCTGQQPSLGYKTSGILGLGTSGASLNFLGSQKFAISINSGYNTNLNDADYNMNAGTLTFYYDSAMAGTGTSVFLTSNSNWQTTFIGETMTIGFFSYPFGGNLIFDINTDVIALPTTLFTNVMTALQFQPGITSGSCSASTSSPSCSFYSSLNLPTITLSYNLQTINIPPSVYAQKSGNTVTFFFKAIDSQSTGVNYVTPNYANTIILGNKFMANYYILFDGTGFSNQITIYPTATALKSLIVYAIIGTVAFVVLVVIIVCCVKQRRKRQQQQVVITEEVITTQPLIVAQPVMVGYNQQPNYPPNYPPNYQGMPQQQYQNYPPQQYPPQQYPPSQQGYYNQQGVGYQQREASPN